MESEVNPAAGVANGEVPAASVYGGGAGQGITLPPYFKPTPSVVSASNFFPLLEELGPDEMRISFVGTCPFPPKRDQAATCIMVELGNGTRLFFDFGPGCLRNIAAFQVPVQDVNDIFITHLHVDHYGELPYLYCFAPWSGRWTPLRVSGPSGRQPDEGITEVIEGMKKMTHWHTKAFDMGPVGEGYEVEVNEFDYEDDNGICYDKDGVTVRHWRRSHNMDGASAYRLDWNGLSFVWTGDGRPDRLTAEYAQGADVFVTELQADLGKLMEQKTGIPQQIYNMTIDTVHTDHYATGYVINQVQPRLGMVTHFAYDHEVVNEAIAGVREHWKGLFVLGAPDGVVINVTKDAIWARAAVLPDSGNFKKPATETELRQMFGGQIPASMRIPEPRRTRDELLSPGVRAIEIPPKEFVPADVLRPMTLSAQDAFGPAMGKDLPVQFLFGAKGAGAAVGEFMHALRSLASAVNLLGGGIAGQVLPESQQRDQVQQQLGVVAEMVEQMTRQSDHIREAGSAAVMGAAKSMQDEEKRADLRAGVAALVDVVTTATGQLQQAEVRNQAKQTLSLLIDGLAAQLGSPAVQSGADPTATLKTVQGSAQLLGAGLFAQVLRDPATMQQAQQAVAGLRGFGSTAMAGHDSTPALADALQFTGRMLQDPAKLDAVKRAASALIDIAAAVGSRLQSPETHSALKGGTGLLIDGLGRQMAGVGGQPGAQEGPAVQADS